MQQYFVSSYPHLIIPAVICPTCCLVYEKTWRPEMDQKKNKKSKCSLLLSLPPSFFPLFLSASHSRGYYSKAHSCVPQSVAFTQASLGWACICFPITLSSVSDIFYFFNKYWWNKERDELKPLQHTEDVFLALPRIFNFTQMLQDIHYIPSFPNYFLNKVKSMCCVYSVEK